MRRHGHAFTVTLRHVVYDGLGPALTR